MDDENLKILDELNKGCSMGEDAIEVILEKIENEDFKKTTFDLIKRYKELSLKVTKLHDKSSKEEIKETSTMSKVMTWYGIQIRTITDSSDSKLSEMIMQGLTMGIIDGKKLLKNKHLDKKVKSLINEYVDMQEEYVEKIKPYL